MRLKRGQTATEVLVILAAVLILLSGITYVVSGGFSFPSSFAEQSTRRYWRSEQVGISAYSFNESMGRMQFVNNLDSPIALTFVNLSGGVVFSGSKKLDSNEKVLIDVSYGVSTSHFENISVVLGYSDLKNGQDYFIYGRKPLIGDRVVSLN